MTERVSRQRIIKLKQLHFEKPIVLPLRSVREVPIRRINILRERHWKRARPKTLVRQTVKHQLDPFRHDAHTQTKERTGALVHYRSTTVLKKLFQALSFSLVFLSISFIDVVNWRMFEQIFFLLKWSSLTLFFCTVNGYQKIFEKSSSILSLFIQIKYN